MSESIEHFHLKKAVFYILISALSYSIMALFVKFATKTVAVDKIIMFRFGISLLYALLIIAIRKILRQNTSLKTNHLVMQIFRAIFGMLGMVLLYTSLKYIPIVDAILLAMTSALFIPIIGVVFFRSKISHKHWIAIIIGFIGVAFILKPGHELFDLYSLLALTSGLTIAISLILTRKLAKYDKHYVCMFYMFFITFLVSGTYGLLTWKTPDLQTFLLLLGVGIFGTFYQDFMIRASAYAPSKIISSLLYSTLIYSIFFDWLFFKSIPNIVTWIGIILVVSSSILTVYGAKSQKEVMIKK